MSLTGYSLSALKPTDVNGTGQITFNGRTHALIDGMGQNTWWPASATLCSTEAPVDGHIYNDVWSAAKEKPYVVDWSAVTCKRCLRIKGNDSE